MADASLPLLVIIFAFAIAFGLANGFNDAANAIATVIGTRALSPRAAIAMAAVLNFAGAATGTAVAVTIGKGILTPGAIDQWTLLAALFSAVTWVVIATYWGLPVSVSHSLIAGLVGVDELVADILADLRDGSAVPAGIIGEIGCSWPWTEAERRSMQAAVIAQQETGAALTIHPGRHPDAPFEILALVRAAGADLSRTIMDHVERRLFAIDDILRLADTGCVIEFDMFGMETSRFAQAGDVDLASDGVRLTAIGALIDAGHGDRIVISHDICQRTRQTEFGGHGCGHIYRNIVPMMRRRGFSQDHIDAILVKNPARLLTFAK